VRTRVAIRWAARPPAHRARHQFIVKEVAERAGVNLAASIHWLGSPCVARHRQPRTHHARFGPVDPKTAGIHAHARSGRYLQTKF